MPPRRQSRRKSHRKLLFWIGGVVAALVLLPVIVLGALILTIDPNSYKGQIEAAVQQATGRALHIGGPISLVDSLSPTLTARDVTLANMADGTRPDMLRVAEMRIEIAPRALLTGRVVVSRLILLHPDILLETDAAGHANWQFTPPARPASAAAAGAPSAPPSTPPAARLRLETLHVHDARLTFRNGVTGVATVFTIPRIAATALTASSPVSFGAEFTVGGHDFTLTAQTGPLSRLRNAATGAPWALYMNITVSGATLTLSGSVGEPLRLRGYSLRVDGAIPDLARLSWLAAVKLPPLNDVSFSARLLDEGGRLPDISAVSLHAGSTSLESVSPGFVLDDARLDMPSLSEPVIVTADGSYAGQPLRVRATLGAPAQLLPTGLIPRLAPPPGPFNIDAAVQLAGASLAARGSIAAPATHSGMDITLGARIPDLGSLSALAGRELPGLSDLAFSGHLVDGPGGFDRAIGLRGAVLTLPQADLSGAATLHFAATPALEASFVSQHVDADALRAAFAAAARINAATVHPEPLDQLAAAATRPPALPSAGRALIPDTPVPFALLGRANVDLTGKIGSLTLAGMTATDVAGHVATRNGVLAAGPITGRLPGGAISLTAGANSHQPAPPVALAIRAPGVDLARLLAAFGVVDPPTGTLTLNADLRAAGRSLRAMAGTLEGRIGIGLTDAGIDNALLGGTLDRLLRGTGLPAFAGAGGRSTLRCLVLRATVAGGVADLGTATLDSGRLLVSGGGTANLGAETMDLQLRPLLSTGASSPGIVVPIHVAGGWRDPKVTLEQNRLASANLRTGLGALAGLLGARPAARALEAPPPADACGPALAALGVP